MIDESTKSRWQPKITEIHVKKGEEERNKYSGQVISPQLVEVTLGDRQEGSKVKFKRGTEPTKDDLKVDRLNMFDYVEGSIIGELFPVYEVPTEDGKVKKVHLYHSKRIDADEVPVDLPIPVLPSKKLEDVYKVSAFASLHTLAIYGSFPRLNQYTIYNCARRLGCHLRLRRKHCRTC